MLAMRLLFAAVSQKSKEVFRHTQLTSGIETIPDWNASHKTFLDPKHERISRKTFATKNDANKKKTKMRKHHHDGRLPRIALS